jgi:head-tail adaptor
VPENLSGQLSGSSGIGSLRWLVTLYRRDQSPGADSALSEHLVRIGDVHADIQPTYASTFYQTTQVDTPITHMINLRWQDYPPTVDVVVRDTKYPTPRTELFRVRRTKEIAGRKRFIQMECEIEHSRVVPDDSDATRNVWLTEPYTPSGATPAAGTTWDDGDTTWDDGATRWDFHQ